MKPINEYAQEKRVTRRCVELWIKAGKITSTKIGGKVYIIDDKEFEENKDEVIIKDDVKERWDAMLNRAIKLFKQNTTHPEIKAITDKIIKENEKLKLRGYDYKSLRRKITRGIIERKPRSDRFTIKQEILKDKMDVIMSKLTSYFIKDGGAKLNYAVDRLLMEAKENEELWEIAAIKKSTIYQAVNRAIKAGGFRTAHELFNHHNLYEQKRIRAHGSFTNDIGFMDVWALDDHKMDVAGAWVRNDNTGKMELRQVTSWVLIEAHTMMPLAWKVKFGSFNNDDIVDLIAQAILKYGLPKQKIICDQGLGADNRVKQFCYKAGVTLEAQMAYQPTHKATVERFFRLVKDETDALQTNYIGGNHPVEGKHSGLALSPDATQELIEEAINRYDDYFMHMCQRRPRKRGIKGIEKWLDETGRISIATLFENYRRDYTPDHIDIKTLRAAYMKIDDRPRRFINSIKYQGDWYMPLEVQSPSLNGRKYFIAWLPFERQTIDLYAAENFMDTVFGVEYSKGDYVCSLTSQSALSPDERKAKVSKINRETRKLVRSLIPAGLTDEVRTDGSISSVRKSAERTLMNTLRNTLSPDKIQTVIDSVKEKPDEITNESEDYLIKNTDDLSDVDWSNLDDLKI